MAIILSNSNIYLGGSLFGKASSVTCPEIDMDTAEIKYGYGNYNLPVGIKAMKCSIVLTGFYKDVFLKVANPFSEINMTIYGSLDTYTNETLSKSEQAKLVIRGSSQKFGLLGDLKQQDNIEQKIDFNVSAAKLTIDGSEKFHVDSANLIFKVGGTDILTTIKKNLALT